MGKATNFILSAVMAGGALLMLFPIPKPNAMLQATIVTALTACKGTIGPTAWEGFPPFQTRRIFTGPDTCLNMTKGMRGRLADG